MNEYSPKNALSLTVAKVAELLLKEDKNFGLLVKKIALLLHFSLFNSVKLKS